MGETTKTVAELLRENHEAMTRAERQISNALLENYPVSGLGSINSVAARGAVSTPTIVRLVKKLGFAGFPDFQARLRDEIEAKISSPIRKRESWSHDAPDSHILNQFSEAVVGNIGQTMQHINSRDFDQASKLIADLDRSLFLIGGRITRTLADYMFLHLQVMRKDVTHIQPISNAWPHYLLEMKENDVLIIFDIRRYENSILKLAEFAKERKATIILISDEWQSPIAQYADFCFNSRIVVPSAWDSLVATMLLIEAFIASVQELIWPEAKQRMEELEDIFDRTKFFRKFT